LPQKSSFLVVLFLLFPDYIFVKKSPSSKLKKITKDPYKISAEHSIAREEVSDNYVLSQLNPKVYSECLVGLAEKTCLISNLPATVGMADKTCRSWVLHFIRRAKLHERKARRQGSGGYGGGDFDRTGNFRRRWPAQRETAPEFR
jgi:hypothetical protein